MNNISFGSIPSLEDKRTIQGDKADGYIPKEYNLVNLRKPTTNDLCNQGKNGICTACASRMGAEHYFNDNTRLAEYWFYLMGKVLVDSNLYEGSSALTMLKTANKYGIPTKDIEYKYPLNTDSNYADFINSFKTRYGGKIPQEILDNASKHKIGGYYKINVDPVEIAKELENNRVIICRFTVGDNTYKDEFGNTTWDKNKLFPLRPPKKIDGGHLWCINENKGLDENAYMAGPNSWSVLWGDDGYFNFIFKTQKPYFTEAWVIADIPKEVIEEKKKNDFKVDLKYGMKHPDVKLLQQFLNNNGFTISPIGAGSKGKETEYFGRLTQLALIRFQRKYKITPAQGYFGRITRSIINAIK